MAHINYKHKYLIFFFKIVILLIKIKEFFFESCDYDTPLYKGSSCIEGYCTPEQIENKVCIINNEIIETQWFNNILPVSTENYSYIDITTMLNGDLLIETSSYPRTQQREFYGLKKNGRPYFKNKENNKEIANYSMNTTSGRFESYIFGVKLNGTEDESEYLVSMTKDHANNMELYDFEKGITYEVNIKNFFFGAQTNTLSSSIIKLRTSDD